MLNYHAMSPTKDLDENAKERILREVQANSIEALEQFKEEYPETHWCELRYKKTGDTVLHVASRLGHVNMVTFLLTHYAPAVDFRDRDDKTALHEAAQFAQYNAIEALLNHGADVNALKRADWTPLMLACTKIQDSSYKTVKLLLNRGALVNYENKDGWTVLHIISREGSSEILNLLLKHGLDVRKITRNGRSALHVAALHGCIDVVKLLLILGLDVNLKDNCGNIPLHEAVLGGNIAVCSYLLNNKPEADLRAVNNMGFGVLHLAASVGNLDVIKYLLDELKVNVNAKSHASLTALHCAARKRHADAVQLLISLGADVTLKDSFGRCATDYIET